MKHDGPTKKKKIVEGEKKKVRMVGTVVSDNHIELDEGIYRAREFMDSIRKIRDELNTMRELKLAMAQMIDNVMVPGEGEGDEVRYQKVVDLFGVKGASQSIKLNNAKRLFDETNSTLGNIHASLPQLISLLS